MDTLYTHTNPFRTCGLCGRMYRLSIAHKARQVCPKCLPEYREALARQEDRELERIEHQVVQALSVTENRGNRKVSRLA